MRSGPSQSPTSGPPEDSRPTAGRSAGGPCANTDRELWRGKDSAGFYYAPSIHVTGGGAIGISVGGHTVVMSVEKWHDLARDRCVFPPRETAAEHIRNALTVLLQAGEQVFIPAPCVGFRIEDVDAISARLTRALEEIAAGNP